VAWCELRNGFRNFRTDRIARLDVLPDRYPRPRHSLLDEWRAQEGIEGD
jgi:predicted DNA-binding transcriptional regulator YafY